MIKIERASAADCDAIAALVASLAQTYILPEFDAKAREHFLAANSSENIQQLLAQGFVYHLALAGDELIGLVGMRAHSHLYHLFVAKSHHRQGLARQLWLTARDHALANGNSGCFTVNSSNYAIAVYRAFGFQQTAELQQHLGVWYTPMQLQLVSA